LQSWGALDRNYAYKANLISASYRGYARDPGGGLGAAPVAGEPIKLSDILQSQLWRHLRNFALHEFQTTMFQPVGGMDMIGKAFAREVGDLFVAYVFDGANAYEFTSMGPSHRVARAVELGSRLHPQYRAEFENGIAVAWHRVPFTLGCAGSWTDEMREAHYDNLCQIDGR